MCERPRSVSFTRSPMIATMRASRFTRSMVSSASISGRAQRGGGREKEGLEREVGVGSVQKRALTESGRRKRPAELAERSTASHFLSNREVAERSLLKDFLGPASPHISFVCARASDPPCKLVLDGSIVCAMRPIPTRNPQSPWESTHVEYLEEAPPTPLEVFEDDSKSILSKNDSPDVGFRWSVNPYRGCFHGCAYCYARPSHEYLGFGSGTDFERKIVVKRRAPELLR